MKLWKYWCTGALLVICGACQSQDQESSFAQGFDPQTTYTQVDRVGKPAVATLLIHDGGLPIATTTINKERYNREAPFQDLEHWKSTVTQSIKVFRSLYGNAGEDAEVLAGILLPDVLTVDLKRSGVSTFLGEVLTSTSTGGRALEDDVVDAALATVLFPGKAEALKVFQSDGVSANDQAFLAAFPYLALPHR